MIRDDANRPISRAEGLDQGKAVEIEFADGRVSAVTGESAAATAEPAKEMAASEKPKQPRKKPAAKTRPPEQGSLF